MPIYVVTPLDQDVSARLGASYDFCRCGRPKEVRHALCNRCYKASVKLLPDPCDLVEMVLAGATGSDLMRVTGLSREVITDLLRKVDKRVGTDEVKFDREGCHVNMGKRYPLSSMMGYVGLDPCKNLRDRHGKWADEWNKKAKKREDVAARLAKRRQDNAAREERRRLDKERVEREAADNVARMNRMQLPALQDELENLDWQLEGLRLYVNQVLHLHDLLTHCAALGTDADLREWLNINSALLGTAKIRVRDNPNWADPFFDKMTRLADDMLVRGSDSSGGRWRYPVGIRNEIRRCFAQECSRGKVMAVCGAMGRDLTRRREEISRRLEGLERNGA